MITPVNAMKFDDLVGEVEYKPLVTPENEFSGFYLPYVNGQRKFPVSEDFVVVKTSDVVDLVRDEVVKKFGSIKFEKTIDFGTYHKHVIIPDYEIVFDDKLFESELLNDGINIPIDYDINDYDKDILGLSVEIYNSYCGLCRLNMFVKVLRFVCVNGVVVGEKIDNLVVKHNTLSHNIEEKIKTYVPKIIEGAERIFMEYLPKFKKEISFKEALYILDRASKLGISKRYLNDIKENIISVLEKKMTAIKLWWLFNFITYQIERSKTIANIATKQYTIYKSLLNEIDKMN